MQTARRRRGYRKQRSARPPRVWRGFDRRMSRRPIRKRHQNGVEHSRRQPWRSRRRVDRGQLADRLRGRAVAVPLHGDKDSHRDVQQRREDAADERQSYRESRASSHETPPLGRRVYLGLRRPDKAGHGRPHFVVVPGGRRGTAGRISPRLHRARLFAQASMMGSERMGCRPSGT